MVPFGLFVESNVAYKDVVIGPPPPPPTKLLILHVWFVYLPTIYILLL